MPLPDNRLILRPREPVFSPYEIACGTRTCWSQELRLNGTQPAVIADFTVGAFYFEQGGTLEARVVRMVIELLHI